MTDFWLAMGLIALPAVGSVVGGLLALKVEVSARVFSLILHAVAGMLLGVVGVELMPQALQTDVPWMIVLVFIAGGLFMMAVDWGTHVASELGGGARAGGAAAWVIFIGVAVDFFTDGLLIASGLTISQGLGFLLGLAALAADSPEAFATIATLRKQGGSARAQLLVIASFPVLLFGGTALGYVLLLGQPREVQFGVLAFTAGVLIALVVEEVVPQSHGEWDGRLATLALLSGFGAFALLSSYIS